jgi:hypothetical protein
MNGAVIKWTITRPVFFANATETAIGLNVTTSIFLAVHGVNYPKNTA